MKQNKEMYPKLAKHYAEFLGKFFVKRYAIILTKICKDVNFCYVAYHGVYNKNHSDRVRVFFHHTNEYLRRPMNKYG